ncbi:MAG: threonine synthase [Desulfobacterales bacterium]|nr:threonine synthase [Desulfobacterales bacterium]
MKQILYYSTNNLSEKVDFRTALLNGLASNYGLYMISRNNVPVIERKTLVSMKEKSYPEIAFTVLSKFLEPDINLCDLEKICKDAYDERIIPTDLRHVTGKTYIMWLTNGPTYSFKDYAARFFGRILNYYLEIDDTRRVVVVATSGDTGGAVADALHSLDRIDNIVFFPKGAISSRQRRQMTTLKKNIYAFEVNGDFDICQAIAKRLLADKKFAKDTFENENILTSANSISIGRLLPQAVYPFYAYSKLAEYPEKTIICIPSGNFGNLMGTILSQGMGLPIEKIVCGVNENREFPDFLETGEYTVKPSVYSPSTAMVVSNPSNIARIFDWFGGHVSDQRDKQGRVVEEGFVDIIPDIKEMNEKIFSSTIKNDEHYSAIKEVYEIYGIMIEPHGAVGWATLKKYLKNKHNSLSIIYETADPGKFPEEIKRAVNVRPGMPEKMSKQANKQERIYSISSQPIIKKNGAMVLSDEQYQETMEKIESIYEEKRSH